VTDETKLNMIYDYTFFWEHLKRRRRYKSINYSAIESGVTYYFGHVVSDDRLITETITNNTNKEKYITTHTYGGYLRGATSALDKLANAMRCDLPDDFVQFYQEFGEALVISRTDPLWLWNEEKMIQEFKDDFERDFDEEFPEGRFFRFAYYPTEPTREYGLLKNHLTDSWEIVAPPHGIFYEEMVGLEGREHYGSGPFYDWLKSFIERDGYPDFYPPEEDHFYSQSLD
jgi:hypothetical protein